MNKIFLSFVAVIFLSGCSGHTVQTAPAKRLNISLQNEIPLELKDVHWSVKNKTYTLDEQNFKNLQANQQSIQDRLEKEISSKTLLKDYYND